MKSLHRCLAGSFSALCAAPAAWPDRPRCRPARRPRPLGNDRQIVELGPVGRDDDAERIVVERLVAQTARHCPAALCVVLDEREVRATGEHIGGCGRVVELMHREVQARMRPGERDDGYAGEPAQDGHERRQGHRPVTASAKALSSAAASSRTFTSPSACPTKRRPAVVKAIGRCPPRRDRSISTNPVSRSRRASCWETADGDTCNASAAPTTPPCRSTARGRQASRIQVHEVQLHPNLSRMRFSFSRKRVTME